MSATPRIAAAILAAGTGEPQRLRELAMRVCASPCERVAVVLGAGAGAMTPVLHGLPLRIETNVLWSEGIASSIRSAVAWALRSGCDGLLLLACDHHRVTATHLERLIATYRSKGDVVASRCVHHGLGAPAVFHGTHFGRLGALTGDHGPQVIVGTTPRVVAVDWPESELDVAA
ncbi:MAG: NTP transferase domain-containing protein [Deltaproteobacteria bacterium]|nr:NTP transferase domain-containing protein [Deltaproteobacteria bacterium]